MVFRKKCKNPMVLHVEDFFYFGDDCLKCDIGFNEIECRLVLKN